ncbi:MAG: Zn-ribbon domain-containing OB-fold protein, partial [Candidatus Odinarchaeia archaeon]
RLEGAKCLKCGKIFFPPRIICSKCKSKELEIIPLPRKGKVVTYTVVHNAPQNYKVYVPYIVALIELENGVRVTSQLTDCDPDKIKIGTPVEAVIRRLYTDGENGLIHYGYKFRPLIE